ncbi:MAG: hypothetical protein C5B56_03110 [Proteobacteria bacterium]|nr:MAG: hypothetical protein C5B56_03110 [Pseudomonadota bacterium]
MKRNALLAFSCAFFAAVSSFAQQAPGPLNTVPSRIVGHAQPEQLTIASALPNLVEGRELFSPEGIAIDTSVSPPILYVADTGNNRVLGWQNALNFKNGQPADLVIGQQDKFHTFAQGPSGTFSSGLAGPTGLAVDPNGNLYVADTNNNRILRYPRPFANIPGAGQLAQPDLYVGQPNLNSRTANFTGTISDQGLNLAGSPWPVNIALDGQGNLWVVDGGNRRVLRFTSTDISRGNSGDAFHANLVLGQLDFTSNNQPAPSTGSAATVLNAFAIPVSVNFDAAGNLYVTDSSSDSTVSRVLVFKPPFATNQAAARVIAPVRTTQDTVDKTVMGTPSATFFIPGSSKMGVVDTFRSRILIFDSFDKWPDPTASVSPLATGQFGQPDFHSSFPNAAAQVTYVPAPSATSLATPLSGAFFNGELYIADTGNSRVVVVPFTAGSNLLGPSATRLLGQDTFAMSAPNLIEGREFDFFTSTTAGNSADAGLAVDFTSDTPHLYVADPYNNRVLGFKDFRKVAAGAKADIVIGQPDMSSGLCNVTGNRDAPSASSLCRPVGLAVDGNGDLYVADSFNSRVLRFPAPFNHQGQEQADLVLGQRNFTARVTDPSSSTMAQPYGVTVSSNNGLLVSDAVHNRVLLFPFTSNGSFRGFLDNGMAATKVLGSPDFNTPLLGNTDATFNSPRHIAVDNEARVYVADAGNNRVMIFDQLPLISNGAHASLQLTGLSAPRGIFVNQLSSEIWVTDTNSSNGAVRKYPNYGALILNPASTFTVQAVSNPLAVAQDQFGDLMVADASSRVGFYFPALQAINGASFLPKYPLAPGLLTSLCAPSSNCNGGAAMFGSDTAANTGLPNPYPMPTTLADVQVLFKATNAPGDPAPVPLYYVSPTQINFVVPMNAPSSGTADIQVVQPSTGRIYAAGQANMNVNSPAVLMSQYTGTNRQAAVVNLPDGTVNDPQHPAPRGSYVSIYATGQGFVPNAPADGVPPSSAIATPQAPRVAINNLFTDQYTPDNGDVPQSQWLSYSGLSSYPGLWQINVWIPKGVVAGTQIPVLVVLGSTPSNDNTFRTVITVK